MGARTGGCALSNLEALSQNIHSKITGDGVKTEKKKKNG
jgi:hypothetical protein